MKKILMLVVAFLFASSVAYAGMHGNGMNNGSEQGQMMKNQNSMNSDDGMMMKKSGNKPTPMSCGAGKCGGSKMDKSGSCGAGKCGDSKKEKPKKPSGSCGAGKCG